MGMVLDVTVDKRIPIMLLNVFYAIGGPLESDSPRLSFLNMSRNVVYIRHVRIGHCLTQLYN